MKTPGCDDGTDEVSHTQNFIREVKLAYLAIIASGVVIAVVDCAIFFVNRLHSRCVGSLLATTHFSHLILSFLHNTFLKITGMSLHHDSTTLHHSSLILLISQASLLPSIP